VAQNFNELPSDLKEDLIDRYAGHDGMDAEVAYSQHVPTEIRVQGTEAVRAFYADKQISHIYPRSRYPELTSDMNNTFLEDSAINEGRGADIVTPREAYKAGQDSIRDAYSGDVNGDGIQDFEPQYDKLAELNASTHGEVLTDSSLTVEELLARMETDPAYSQRAAYEAGQASARSAYRGDVNSSDLQDLDLQLTELYGFNAPNVSPSVAEAIAVEGIEVDVAGNPGLAEAVPGEALAEGGVTISELMDADVLESAAGGAFTVAFYVALKTLLSMEGARRRGEVTWADVAEKTFAEVSKVLPMAMAVSLGLGIIVAIFGGWVLIPLMPIAAYYGVKAPIKLVGSYWGGLNDEQKDELRCLARELGGKIQRWIENLDKKQGEGGFGAR
jgi:hypothetical protein